MLPWAMRRRSASGVMSASSIWSAARTTWSGQHDVEVHLLQPGARVLEGPPRHDLQVADLLGRARPAVGFDEPDDHVGPTLRPAPPRGRCAACRGSPAPWCPL